MRLKDHEVLKIYAMGKRLRVAAIFTSEDEAHRFYTNNPGYVTIAAFRNISFAASMYDRGEDDALIAMRGALDKLMRAEDFLAGARGAATLNIISEAICDARDALALAGRKP